MRFLFIVVLLIIQAGCAINHVVKVGDQRVIVQEFRGKGKTMFMSIIMSKLH